MTDTAPAVQDERGAPAPRSPGAGNLLIKIILVGLIDALLIYCLAQAWSAHWWPAVVFFALVLIAVNAVYFSKGSLPLKYLIPGLIFPISIVTALVGVPFFFSLILTSRKRSW